MKKYYLENVPQQVANLTDEVRALRLMVLQLINQPARNQERMDVPQVAEFTGYSPNTIYQLVHKGEIPNHKPEHGGRKLIFFRSEIDQWLKGRKTESSDEYVERKQQELLISRKGGTL